MQLFVNFLVTLTFSFLRGNVNGRDVGYLEPKSPLQTVFNVSQIAKDNQKILDDRFSVDPNSVDAYSAFEDKDTEEHQFDDRIDHRTLGCEINIRDLPQRTPLLRDPRTKDILYPDAPGASVITLRKGEQFEIDCPGSNIRIDGHSIGEVSEAVCVSGTTVRVFAHTVEYGDVLCQRIIASVARYTEHRCFGNKGREIEIGFKFSDGHFIQLMLICFDSNAREVFYSKFEMHHRIGDQNTGGTRPSWAEGDFYNLAIRLNQLYPNAAQRAQINSQLGLPDDDTKYVKPTGNYFLARGHLTANADMFYYSQQEATFWYMNAVPQWQTFNGFNWAYLERNVRQLAAGMRLDFEVITGTHGISTLPHEHSGRPVPLYLYADDTGKRAIPVPAVFYKIIYSPSTQQGVAIIGINNPYQADIEESIFCNDVANKLTWLSFDRTREDRGYIYACTIADLRKVIPELPNYRVSGLLT